MSGRSLLLIGCSIGLTACASLSPPPAPDIASTASAPVDSVWFTGSSNIRHFICRTTQVAVSAEAAIDEFDRTRVDGMPAVSSGALAIPVQSLDCGIQKMNQDLLVTLGATTNPTISFRLWNYVVFDRKEPRSVRMNGLLRMAGKEKMMVVYGKVQRNPGGDLRLRGKRMIDVREYGIVPPTKFLGLVRVNKNVTVHFDIAVRPLIDPLGVLTSSLQ